MKILFPILSFYPSQHGGPGNTVYWMARALKTKGIESVVVTTDLDIKRDHRIKLNNWVFTEYGKVWYQKTRFVKIPLKALKVSLHEINKIDIIHLSSVFYPLSWFIAFFNKIIFNKPIIFSPRGELDPAALIYHPIRKKIILKLYKYFLTNNATFHATCQEEANHILRVFGKDTNIVQIPNLIPVSPPSVSWHLKENQLLYLGRIHPIKGIENLIKSLALSGRFSDSNHKLLIAGKGIQKYEQTLMDIVRDLHLEKKVEFIGHIEGVEKIKIISHSKFLILPSNTENFGNVVVEALENFTPVIASKGTPWQILEEYNAGIWTKNDKFSLAAAIDKLLTLNSVDYNQMCINARNLVEQKFDVNKNIYQWNDVYHSLFHDKV